MYLFQLDIDSMQKENLALCARLADTSETWLGHQASSTKSELCYASSDTAFVPRVRTGSICKLTDPLNRVRTGSICKLPDPLNGGCTRSRVSSLKMCCSCMLAILLLTAAPLIISTFLDRNPALIGEKSLLPEEDVGLLRNYGEGLPQSSSGRIEDNTASFQGSDKFCDEYEEAVRGVAKAIVKFPVDIEDKASYAASANTSHAECSILQDATDFSRFNHAAYQSEVSDVATEDSLTDTSSGAPSLPGLAPINDATKVSSFTDSMQARDLHERTETRCSCLSHR